MTIKLKSLEEVLQEMSVAGYGDWTPSKEMIGTITKFVLNKKWIYLDELNVKGTNYKVYKQQTTYILGRMIHSSEGKEEFEVDFEIQLTEQKSIANSFKFNKPLMNVDGVRVKETKQGYGLATIMYRFLVKNEGFIILGDEIQYFGARKLWSKLSNYVDIIVDIIDISKDVVIETNVKVKHGDLDHQFDERIWDYSCSKKDIRLVLKDIQ
jgi:hypothetical protein